MRIIALVSVYIAIVSAVLTTPVSAHQLTGEISRENRLFLNDPSIDRQSSNALNSSTAFELEYFHEWDNRQQRAFIKPFYRIDNIDADRSRFDLREAYWQLTTYDWELSIGNRKIFWGVAESQHLVDIINQTDFIENPDGEDKLGQPMVQLSLFNDYGDWSIFVMPYFRERTFPGRSGRLRPLIPVDKANPIYESSAEEHHIDYALRWFNTLGDIDVGVSFFSGTSREPRFRTGIDDQGNTVFLPLYEQIRQTSIDLQWTTGAWLWKLESFYRSGQGDDITAAVGGFEYTFFDVNRSGIDIGLLSEYHADSRGEESLAIFEDDLFLGSRIAFNDVPDLQILGGAVIDMDGDGHSLLIEASRRITESISAELELRVFHSDEELDFTYAFRNDDYIQMTVIYFF